MQDLTNHNQITYSTSTMFDLNKLDDLTESVGWGRRGLNAWQRIMDMSSLFVTAWHEHELVGLGRILEDGVMCMVYDIATHPDYRKRGIGTRIMQRILEEVRSKEFASVGLFAWDKNPTNISFYEKLGFKRVDFGMKLRAG